MKRINAYTLMEVTIAMLLSAICISVCYTAYGIIGDYYKTFRLKNDAADAVLSLQHALEKDFLKSRHIISTGNGLKVQQDSTTILYTFREQAILRELPGIHTDTFKMAYNDLHFFFEGAELHEQDTLDRMDMKIILDKTAPLQLRIDKKYSAEDLFNH